MLVHTIVISRPILYVHLVNVFAMVILLGMEVIVFVQKISILTDTCVVINNLRIFSVNISNFLFVLIVSSKNYTESCSALQTCFNYLICDPATSTCKCATYTYFSNNTCGTGLLYVYNK